MSQDNQFHQYGYDHYLKAPVKPRPHMRTTIGLRSRLIRKIQSPAVATVALVIAAVAFVGIIVATYPSGDETQKQIPIVKADLRPIKTHPVERGGMAIPHRDSTILARVGQPGIKADTQKIENLLARENDALMSKEQAIEHAMAQNPMDRDPLVPEELAMEMKKKAIPTLLREGVDGKEELEVDDKKEIDVVDTDIKLTFELKEPTAKDILQKIGSSEEQNDKDSSEFSQKAASAAIALKPERSQIHAAATSPETLEFVRNILNENEGQSSSARNMESIEPAAGASSSAANIPSEFYFVQLASITDPARAGKEWAKMQARYYVLSKSKFRVQEASLARGTFYRIQAGPMSREDANEICRALKRANKPGGCLVVK